MMCAFSCLYATVGLLEPLVRHVVRVLDHAAVCFHFFR